MPLAQHRPIDCSLFPDARRGPISAADRTALAPLLALANWRHLILPQCVDFAAKFGNDLATQTPFQWTVASIQKSAADAAFNGRDVWNFTANDGDLMLLPGSVAAVRTVIMVAAMSAAMMAQTTAFFTTVYSPRLNKTAGSLSWAGSTFNEIIWSPTSGTGAVSVTAPQASLPAATVPFVVVADYDGTTGAETIYINDPLNPIAGRGDGIVGPSIDASYQYRIGCAFGGSVGAVMKMGAVGIYDGVMDDDERSAAVTALKTYYGIA